MTPLQFVSDIGGDYNAPAGRIAKALTKTLVIRTSKGEYQVLSYYYDKDIGRMVIDISKE